MPGGDVDAVEARRVPFAEVAEEHMVGGDAEPSLGWQGGTDERGGGVDAVEDVAKEVVITEASVVGSIEYQNKWFKKSIWSALKFTWSYHLDLYTLKLHFYLLVELVSDVI